MMHLTSEGTAGPSAKNPMFPYIRMDYLGQRSLSSHFSTLILKFIKITKHHFYHWNYYCWYSVVSLCDFQFFTCYFFQVNDDYKYPIKDKQIQMLKL